MNLLCLASSLPLVTLSEIPTILLGWALAAAALWVLHTWILRRRRAKPRRTTTFHHYRATQRIEGEHRNNTAAPCAARLSDTHRPPLIEFPVALHLGASSDLAEHLAYDIAQDDTHFLKITDASTGAPIYCQPWEDWIEDAIKRENLDFMKRLSPAIKKAIQEYERRSGDSEAPSSPNLPSAPGQAPLAQEGPDQGPTQ